jgi:hypothetical protein
MKWFWDRIFISITIPLIGYSCSTTDNWTLHPLYKNVGQIPTRLTEVLEESYRKNLIYRNYDTKMIAAGLFRSENYREFLVDSLQSSYKIAKSEKSKISIEQKQQFANQFEFLLFVYPGSNQKTDFGERDSLWQARLYDDDGDRVIPTKIQKLQNNDRERVLLSSYLKDLDRWMEVYKISFPKLNKPATGVELGSKSIKLEISGLEGHIEFNWDDPKNFY